MLVIGDSLTTDVAAAAAGGFDSALVPTGVLAEDVRLRHDMAFPCSSLSDRLDFLTTRPGKRKGKRFALRRDPAWVRGMFDDPQFTRRAPTPNFFVPDLRW